MPEFAFKSERVYSYMSELAQLEYLATAWDAKAVELYRKGVSNTEALFFAKKYRELANAKRIALAGC